MSRPPGVPDVMAAVVLSGHGGYDRLEYRTDVPVPRPGADQVLVRVRTCGLNNTDVNTRTGWYSPSVRDGITAEGAAGGFAAPDDTAGGWGQAIELPRIQGADVCGEVAALGSGVDGNGLLGCRVLIDPWWLDPHDPGDRSKARYFGSEVDGGFAQYCVAPVANIHPIESGLTDAELATFPCSTGTAEHLLSVAEVADGDTVVITGASGGAGTRRRVRSPARSSSWISERSSTATSGSVARPCARPAPSHESSQRSSPARSAPSSLRPVRSRTSSPPSRRSSANSTSATS